jgi:group I intron endonuclease
MPRKERTDSEGVVYLIKFPNKKYYVGITATSFEERKRNHLSHANTSNLPVHNAMLKYGKKVKWEVIDKADNWDDLTDLEIRYIKEYNSYIDDNGYNLTKGGDGTIGYKHSKEDNLRNSKRRTKYFEDPSNKAKQSEANKLAHRNNPQQAKNHSEFQKKRFQDESERERVAKGMRKYLSKKENLERHSRVRGGKEFYVLDLDDNVVAEYLIQAECAREMKLQTSKINNCLKGKRKTHGGFRFKYK